MRFFVDERGGCIAVRDRTKVDPDRKGLGSDMRCVVWFQMGFQLPTKCPHCNQTKPGPWEVPYALKQKAQAECDRLNAAQPEGQP